MNNQSDAKLLKTAKLRVSLAMAGIFICLCLYFIVLYSVLNLRFFEGVDIDIPFFVSMVCELVGWMLIFLSLESGKPKNRYIYYGGVVMELLLSVYIFYCGFKAETGQFTYVIWGFCSLIKVYMLYGFGRWLKNSKWARIFFDKTIIIHGTKNAAQSYSASGSSNIRQNPVQRSMPDEYEPARPGSYKTNSARPVHSASYSGSNGARPVVKDNRVPSYSSEGIQNKVPAQGTNPADARSNMRMPDYAATEKPKSGPSTKEVLNTIRVKVLTYPVLAMRLGIVVYGEMIIFPIITELLRFLLMSRNGQYNFATTGIFTLSIISAAIWTIAIFFLYLNQPSSRKVVTCCFITEAAVNLFYAFFVLRGYMNNPEITYAPHVYYLFAGIDILRYPLIIYAAAPVYSLKKPAAFAENQKQEQNESNEDTSRYFEGEEEEEVSPSLAETLAGSYKKAKERAAKAVSKMESAGSQTESAQKPVKKRSEEKSALNSESGFIQNFSKSPETSQITASFKTEGIPKVMLQESDADEGTEAVMDNSLNPDLSSAAGSSIKPVQFLSVEDLDLAFSSSINSEAESLKYEAHNLESETESLESEAGRQNKGSVFNGEIEPDSKQVFFEAGKPAVLNPETSVNPADLKQPSVFSEPKSTQTESENIRTQPEDNYAKLECSQMRPQAQTEPENIQTVSDSAQKEPNSMQCNQNDEESYDDLFSMTEALLKDRYGSKSGRQFNPSEKSGPETPKKLSRRNRNSESSRNPR